MRKRFLLFAIGLLLAGAVAAILAFKYTDSNRFWAIDAKSAQDKELAAASAKVGGYAMPKAAEPAPLPLSHVVRLAIGALGFTDNEQNGELADLILSGLGSATGLELVDRQSINAALRETQLTLSGLVRARDAVRVGKMLKADWFLLGTAASVNGTNALVVRIVDARTGITRDAGVFPKDRSKPELAASVAGFVRQSRQSAAAAKPRVYLAIGGFKDVSVNNRQAGFPVQLRGYLTAAYQGSGVTLLEREYADTLLQEMQLDLAGLTEGSATNGPAPLQSAFWLVDGYYQSYETTNLQVELTLAVQRIFGLGKRITLRGEPGEPVCRDIKAAIDRVMNDQPGIVVPSRVSEIRAQMSSGRELLGVNTDSRFAGYFLTITETDHDLDPVQANKRERNLQEAIRAFQTVLLLDPGNRQAKIYLSRCLRFTRFNRVEEARGYYREIIEDPTRDQWTEIARQALVRTFENWNGRVDNPQEKARWFEGALGQNSNSPVAEFYRAQAQLAERDLAIARGEGPKVEELAETRLLEGLRSLDDALHGRPGSFGLHLALEDYLKSFGTNDATNGQRLAELLPKLTNQYPQLEPYLLAAVVTFQVDTNAPIEREFQQRLSQLGEHPNLILNPTQFWGNVPGDIYTWAYGHKLFGLASQAMETKLRAAIGNAALSTGTNEDRIALAFSRMAAEQWQAALDIFNGFSNRPVVMSSQGPWGQPLESVLTANQAALCIQKLGGRTVHDQREFQMGKPCFCLCSPSAFAVEENGLWIGIDGQLLHLDFDLRTNLIVTLPSQADITSLIAGPASIWIGTDGKGLIEVDKATHKCRVYTEKDGLMMENIASLCLGGRVLWIGYGRRTYEYVASGKSSEGGLGLLDLSSGHFTSYTPSFTRAPADTAAGPAAEAMDQPTRGSVIFMAAGNDGDVWFITESGGLTRLRHYRPGTDTWEGAQQACSFVLADQKRLFLGQFWNYTGADKSSALGLAVLDFKDGKWRSLVKTDLLPSGALSALAFDGDNLWVGGMGYIALVDPAREAILKFARIQTPAVDSIQIGGGYLWAQYDSHLHRAPLSNAR
jgi:hypothetical protein